MNAGLKQGCFERLAERTRLCFCGGAEMGVRLVAGKSGHNFRRRSDQSGCANPAKGDEPRQRDLCAPVLTQKPPEGGFAAPSRDLSCPSAEALARIACCGRPRSASRGVQPSSSAARAGVFAIGSWTPYGDAAGRIKGLLPYSVRLWLSRLNAGFRSAPHPLLSPLLMLTHNFTRFVTARDARGRLIWV
jgi:hypothetical protein